MNATSQKCLRAHLCPGEENKNKHSHFSSHSLYKHCGVHRDQVRVDMTEVCIVQDH